MSDFIGAQKSYISFDEKSTFIMEYIDTIFHNVALNLGAVGYHIPAMIDEDVLCKCGYFSSFPQHLTVAAHANPNMYSKVATDMKLTNETVVASNQYFTPAACLHIYPMLQGEEIASKTVTTKARVYRYEDDNFNGKTRVWDFTVREIVFIGNNEFVQNSLEFVKLEALKFVQSIALPANIYSASDNFYPTKKNSVKQKLQLSNSLKYELVVPIDKKDVAIASFNYHDSHFSKPFEFDKNGEIVTGCVGFGLERWVAAIKEYDIKINDKGVGLK